MLSTHVSNNKTENEHLPILVVVMGVSGSGKTTLAYEVAKCLDMNFVDADSFHSEDAIKQMSAGIPLTDEQRAPWITRICQQLNQFELQNKNYVLAYSGLKQKHRQLIFSAYRRSIGVLLDADEALIAQRLAGRGGHFMSPQLLSSQIASMEPINRDDHENIQLLTLSAAKPVDELVFDSVNFISHFR